MHPALVARLVGFGLIKPVATRGTIFLFDQSKISRLRSINRPRNDLGINLPGVAVVLDLVERLRALEYAHPEVTFASGAMWSLWNAFLYARRP